MRLTLFLSLTLAWAGTAAAQITVDQHDGSTDFTARGIAGNVDGWAHNGYKVDRQGGGIGGGILGWSSIMQDQNCATAATFQFAIFGGTAARATGLPVGGWGVTNTWPDVNNILASTATFTSPAGAASACAWIYTTALATPIDTATTSDVFTGTLLVSNLAWANDGTSSHISISQASAGAAAREYPIQSSDSTTIREINTEFGLCWVGRGPAAGGSVLVPGSRQYWLNRLRYTHTSRCGVRDTVGQFGSSFGAAGPLNFGMAGSYPDAANIGRVLGTTQRRDELVWSDQHAGDFAAGAGFGQVLLATTMLRDLISAPLVLPGIGLLELNPTDPIFNLGAAIPGLLQPITNLGTPTIYEPQIPLAQQPGIGAIVHANQVNLYAQVVRVDLAAGTVSLGSLDAHSFRR